MSLGCGTNSKSALILGLGKIRGGGRENERKRETEGERQGLTEKELKGERRLRTPGPWSLDRSRNILVLHADDLLHYY